MTCNMSGISGDGAVGTRTEIGGDGTVAGG